MLASNHNTIVLTWESLKSYLLEGKFFVTRNKRNFKELDTESHLPVGFSSHATVKKSIGKDC